MKLVYQKKEITCYPCKSFFSRFRGFMFQRNIDHALFFDHCNSIHTFFMKEAIDVILCDKENKILYYYAHVLPNRIILPKKGVSRVYELPSFYFDIHINDRLEIRE